MAWNFLASPLRTAKPRIPRGQRIYAVGDVHGRADLLGALFARIDAHLKAYPIAKSVQVFLGDYIDRGPHSREVLDLLVARRHRHTMLYLKGNHEAYAAKFLRNPAIWSDWRHVGGINTLQSYGVRAPASDDPKDLQQASNAFRNALPDSHLLFFNSLAVSFTCGNFFFAHAGVRPGIPLRQQRQQDLLWIREDFLLHEEDFGKMIVHGHTPAKEPDIRPNRINIDTGAYATGRLTCLLIQGDQVKFI